MKKKILVIFTGSMEIGGIERSLIGLLDSFDFEKYDVDLFLYGHHGPLMEYINCNVNILPEVKELSYLRESMKNKLVHGCFYSAALRVVDKFKSCVGVKVDNDSTWAKIVRKKAYTIDKEYDLAISFFLPFDFISEKVHAKRKLGWIHTDYSSYDHNRDAIIKQYDKVDTICAVSTACKNAFIKSFPEIQKEVAVIGNILSVDFIRKMSLEEIGIEEEMPHDGTIKLLSVGRFEKAKNFDNIPEICHGLRTIGLNIKWYIVGFGDDEKLIRQKIVDFQMQDYVIILGKRTNPYPYMRRCDLYVQPSRFEGKCVAVIEAQSLGKPVVITRYPTARTQLQEGVDGVIVGMSNEECTEGIATVLRDTVLMSRLSSNCSIRDYSQKEEMQKIYDFV